MKHINKKNHKGTESVVNSIVFEGEVCITEEQFQKAEQVLMDNGHDLDDAQDILQALGYVLLDVELYPDPLPF